MKGTRGRWWLVYAAGSVIVLAGLAWLTVAVFDLERAERTARAEAARQQGIRLALWRMDAWIGPLLAREAARPASDYLPFAPLERAFTAGLTEIEPDTLLEPSPLLELHSTLLPIHFEVDAEGAWSSPQVPREAERALARRTFVSAERIAECERRLRALEERVDLTQLRAVLDRAPPLRLDARATTEDEAPPPVPVAQGLIAAQSDVDPVQRALLNRQEFQQRTQNTVQNPFSNVLLDIEGNVAPPEALDAFVTPLVPLWLESPPPIPPEILFVRRVPTPGQERLQGFLCDWTSLRTELRALVVELFPDADLVPVPLDQAGAEPDSDELRLASLPARLVATWPEPARASGFRPSRIALAGSWLAALITLVAVGWTLRGTIDLAERRRRFASTVTHELRSPLTTFRMYAEMLAKDMVPEEKRAGYLDTLQRESLRLSILVENVLAYARLEEGRGGLRREDTRAGDLLERVRPTLERHAAAAGMALDIESGDASAAPVRVDADAVEQILFNLVDNAIKYGRSDDDFLELTAREANGALEIRVRDHGPGVPAALARTIFRPFERGAKEDAEPHPGVGLGLALSRGLARDLGGDLLYEAPDGGGACFCLRFPLSV